VYGNSELTGIPPNSSLLSVASILQGRLTAGKREIKDFPKLPSATSFIRKTLYAIALNLGGL